VAKRYLVNDATVEKLGELLNHNPNGLLLFRDELSGFLHTMDRPGHENDRAFYCEAWNGTGAYTYDRIGRGTLAVVIGMSPPVLRQIRAMALGQALRPVDSQDGRDRSSAAGEPAYCPRAGAADLAAAASSCSRILVNSSYISPCSSIGTRDNSSSSGGGAGAGATYLCVGLPNA